MSRKPEESIHDTLFDEAETKLLVSDSELWIHKGFPWIHKEIKWNPLEENFDKSL